MKRIAGYILLAIGILINWPLQIAIGVYGIVYIVRAFMEGSILAGIIAIPVTGICVGIAHFLVNLVLAPLNILIATLLNKTITETASYEELEQQRKQAEREYLDREQVRTQAEFEHSKAQLQKIYISQGMTLEEANQKIEHDLAKAGEGKVNSPGY